jgi:hypothetical protein
MEYTRTIKVGKAEIGVIFQDFPFRIWSRLDDMTSEMFFEQGGRRTGTNTEIGRIKDFVAFNAVSPNKKGNRVVRFKHPSHQGGEKVPITLGDPYTFDNFPTINSDVDYMAELPEAFVREILKTFPALWQRYAFIWRGILSQDEEAQLGGQADADPTELEAESEDGSEEDTSTDGPTSTGARSNAL